MAMQTSPLPPELQQAVDSGQMSYQDALAFLEAQSASSNDPGGPRFQLGGGTPYPTGADRMRQAKGNVQESLQNRYGGQDMPPWQKFLLQRQQQREQAVAGPQPPMKDSYAQEAASQTPEQRQMEQMVAQTAASSGQDPTQAAPPPSPEGAPRPAYLGMGPVAFGGTTREPVPIGNEPLPGMPQNEQPGVIVPIGDEPPPGQPVVPPGAPDPNAPGATTKSPSGSTALTPEQMRQAQQYEINPNDSLKNWIERVYSNSMNNAGPEGLRPSADNPYRNSPYASWYQNRFGQSAGLSTVADILTGRNEGDAASVGARMEGLAGKGGDVSYSQLMDVKKSLNDWNANPGGAGATLAQQQSLANFADDPAAQMQLIANAYRRQTGGWGYSNLVDSLKAQTNEYYNDPAKFNDPATQKPRTPFFNTLLKRAGYGE